MSDWKPTHHITFTTSSASQTWVVMLTDEGAAYTQSEWEQSVPADWEVVEGKWLFMRQPTPTGGPGRVEVAQLHSGPANLGLSEEYGFSPGDLMTHSSDAHYVIRHHWMKGWWVNVVLFGDRTPIKTTHHETLADAIRWVEQRLSGSGSPPS